jgi:hypothetical protein
MSRWWKAVLRADEVWCLIEIRADTIEDMRLKLRKLIKANVKIANIEEV